MRPWNPLAFGRGGAPITGHVPVRLVVLGGTLTGTQAAAVQSFFTACCEEHRLSAAPGFSRHRILHDGTSVKVTILGGAASVVAIVQQSAVEGIGMRLIGWDGALIPALSEGGEAHYYLARPGKTAAWTVTRMPVLDGGRRLWVGADRSRWLSTVYSGTDLQVSAHYKNKTVFGGPAAQANYLPAVLAARRGDAAQNALPTISFLGTKDGAVELLQLGNDGAYAVVDSVRLGDGSGALGLVGAAGNLALVTGGGFAYTIALSPALEVVKEQDITDAEYSTSESTSSLRYVAAQTLAPPEPRIEPFYNNAHWALAPDLGQVTALSPYENPHEDPTYRARLQAARNEFLISGVEFVEGYVPLGTGFWSARQPAGTRVVTSPPTMVSAVATYTELHSGKTTAKDTPWRGMAHSGALVQIGCSVETTDRVEGTTSFVLDSFRAEKTVTRRTETTWELPSGSVTYNHTTEDTYVEDTAVPFPAMAPAAGAVSVSSTVSGTTMDLLHYDHDTDCAVFMKRVDIGSGTAVWEKTSFRSEGGVPVDRATATTPAGEFSYVNSKDPTHTSSGTSVVSVCVYIGGALAYEEALASAPCRVTPVMYEPRVFGDMRFNFNAFTPKPGGGSWPDIEDVYGPVPGGSAIVHTPTLHYGRVVHGTYYNMIPKHIAEGPYSAAEKRAEVQHLMSEGLITFLPDGYVLCDSDGGFVGVAETKPQINGTTEYVLGANVYLVATVGGATSEQALIERRMDRTDAWEDAAPILHPATAGIAGSFSASVGVAKDARSGGLALEISYSLDSFAEPKNRARILLVNGAGVVRLDDLLKPSDGGKNFEFKTTFLATI